MNGEFIIHNSTAPTPSGRSKPITLWPVVGFIFLSEHDLAWNVEARLDIGLTARYLHYQDDSTMLAFLPVHCHRPLRSGSRIGRPLCFPGAVSTSAYANKAHRINSCEAPSPCGFTQVFNCLTASPCVSLIPSLVSSMDSASWWPQETR